MGLVDAVVPAAALYPTALAMAASSSAGPALALQAAKTAIDGGLDGSLDAGLRLESQIFVPPVRDRRPGHRDEFVPSAGPRPGDVPIAAAMSGLAPSGIDFVLFDLDGTLSDSAPGILGSLRQAFAGAGLAPLTADQEVQLLGPPFYDALPPIIGPERVDEVITAYRRFYGDGGMFDTASTPASSTCSRSYGSIRSPSQSRPASPSTTRSRSSSTSAWLIGSPRSAATRSRAIAVRRPSSSARCSTASAGRVPARW